MPRPPMPDDPSDRTATIHQLRQAVLCFRDERDWKQFHDPKNLALGLGIEVAELQELFLWKSQAEIEALITSPMGHERACEELADIAVFVLYLSDALGIDLASAISAKTAKNAAKYPADQFRGIHKKYDGSTG